MKFRFPRFAFALVFASLLAGCASSYCWRPAVPQEMRSVCVPTFRNETGVQELGAIATRQLLREIQREGTFKIRNAGDAAVEIQGVVKSAGSTVGAYDRVTELALNAYNYTAVAEVSVIDKRSRKVLADNLKFRATVQFTSRRDLSTAMRNASGRLMDDLSRQIVDSLLSLKWERNSENE